MAITEAWPRGMDASLLIPRLASSIKAVAEFSMVTRHNDSPSIEDVGNLLWLLADEAWRIDLLVNPRD